MISGPIVSEATTNMQNGSLSPEPPTVIRCRSPCYLGKVTLELHKPRLHPTKPYFCFAPCVDGALTIDREHPYHVKYRYLITDANPDPDWIDEQWTAWHSESAGDE